MSSRYAAGKRAIAECDICGFRYKLRQLKNLVLKGKDTNIKACPTCWNPDHPQLHLGEYPVSDPQALQYPRPDFTGYAQSRALILPSPTTSASGAIGWVHIVIS